MSGPDLWDQFALDPRHPENGHLRASDRDRDVIHEVLGSAYAEGRLTAEEHDERSDQVAASKTLGQLPAIIADLVPVTASTRAPGVRNMRAEAEQRYRQHLRNAFYSWLTPTLICWAIYILTGPGFPWPVFVMIGTGIRLVQLATSREDTIVSIQRSLEKRERKRIETQQRRELRARRIPGRRDSTGEHGVS